MTSFSPVAMADYSLHHEVPAHQVGYINPLKPNLAQNNGHMGGAEIVSAKVDQLSEFEERHLSRSSKQ